MAGNYRNHFIFFFNVILQVYFLCVCLSSAELLKRLDDSSEEVRSTALQALGLWLSNLSKDYNPDFCAPHLQHLFQQLLLHLDDPDASVQGQVLGEAGGGSLNWRPQAGGPADS